MKEKVAIIDSLGSHGSSHHFYLFGQAKGLEKSGVDISIYTNNHIIIRSPSKQLIFTSPSGKIPPNMYN